MNYCGLVEAPLAICFHVPGLPVGKGRPRISTRGGVIRSFTPSKTVAFESRVAFAAEKAMAGLDLIAGPVSMTLNVALPIAQSWSLKKKKSALSGDLKPCSRPDLDNVAKAISDACNGIVYRDDAQIAVLKATKEYAEIPGCFVTVEELS